MEIVWLRLFRDLKLKQNFVLSLEPCKFNLLRFNIITQEMKLWKNQSETTWVYLWEMSASTEYSPKGLRANHMNKLWPCWISPTVHGCTNRLYIREAVRGPSRDAVVIWSGERQLNVWYTRRDESGAELRALSDSSVTSREKEQGDFKPVVFLYATWEWTLDFPCLWSYNLSLSLSCFALLYFDFMSSSHARLTHTTSPLIFPITFNWAWGVLSVEDFESQMKFWVIQGVALILKFM